MYIICRMEAARKWTRNYIVYSSNTVRTIYSAQQKAFNCIHIIIRCWATFVMYSHIDFYDAFDLHV